MIAAIPAQAWWSARRSIATNTIAAMPNENDSHDWRLPR